MFAENGLDGYTSEEVMEKFFSLAQIMRETNEKIAGTETAVAVPADVTCGKLTISSLASRGLVFRSYPFNEKFCARAVSPKTSTKTVFFSSGYGICLASLSNFVNGRRCWASIWK